MHAGYALLSDDQIGLQVNETRAFYGKNDNLKAINQGFDIFIIAVQLYCDELELALSSVWRLLQAFKLFEFEPVIKKSRFRAYLGITSTKYDIPEQLRCFFLLKPETGYSLSPKGEDALRLWAQCLRRVLQDPELFWRLKYARILPSEKKKRREKQKFWALPEDEQINILREYWVMPFRDAKEKFARKQKRLEIYYKYGLKNWDLINAVEKYASAVKPAREQPHLKGMFPAWSGRGRGKPKRVAPKDPEIT